MKNGKAARSMQYLDDELIISAMNESDMNGQNAHLKRRNNMKRNFGWQKWAAIAAMFAIILSVGILVGRFATGNSGAVVALDVNPSIELEVNSKEKVTEVKALNADAQTVIGDMDLTGVDLDVALNAIIGSMMKNGYLTVDKNSILISVDSKNSKKANALKEKISNEVNAMLGESNIDASVITQNYKKNSEIGKLAEENDISEAKATLISKIVAAGLIDANGVPYSYDVLANLNVHELKLILESKEMEVAGITSSGTANYGLYISRNEAKKIALQKAGLSENDVTRLEVETDFEGDYLALIHEVEFRYNGNEYEYDIHATSGEILYEEIKPAGADEDDDNVTPSAECMSRETALAIAYEHAGVNKDNVKRPEIELEKEGNNYIYEIEFKVDGREYEYEINAVTGKIIESESESD